MAQRKEQLEMVANKKKMYTQRMNLAERRKQEEAKVQQDETDAKARFFTTLEQSKDLADNLPDLAEFLQKNAGATGVYIGRL